MVLYYSDNVYFYLGASALMKNKAHIHANKINFEKNFFNCLSSIQIVVIDLKSDLSAWFNVYKNLQNQHKRKFLFYGDYSLVEFLVPKSHHLLHLTPEHILSGHIRVKLASTTSLTRPKKVTLTEKERLIIISAIAGNKAKDIAFMNNISIKTVYHHQNSACKKLGIKKLSRLFQVWNGLLPHP